MRPRWPFAGHPVADTVKPEPEVSVSNVRYDTLEPIVADVSVFTTLGRIVVRDVAMRPDTDPTLVLSPWVPRHGSAGDKAAGRLPGCTEAVELPALIRHRAADALREAWRSRPSGEGRVSE